MTKGETTSDNIGEWIDLAKEIIKIHSENSDTINSDYVIANFDDHDKINIPEWAMTAKSVYDNYIKTLKKAKYWKWSKEKGWEEDKEKYEQVKKLVLLIAIARYNNLNVRNDWIATLNKNKEKNHLVNLIFKPEEKEKEESGMMDNLMKKMEKAQE